ncbi:PAQR family membrane homeostasis protein TrhA [Tenacibaculum pacificus]|uniref:PAQR family membrane homeostasis protein TrhA n=1 Tax=Tenacibaculum pacificus TaxID=3018314 RepID=UPI002FDDDDE2
MSEKLNHNYSSTEEKLNVLTHGFGLLLSIIALPFLILKSVSYQGFWQIASFSIFGCSLIILYAASTFYHASKNAKIRRRLNIFDHAAIYVLIAGSYTPFCLVVLPEKTGWYLFVFVWLFALIGVVLKLFFTGRFDKLSTVLYLIMGWQVIFLINPLIDNLPCDGLFYLIAGGVFYTVGAILYSIKKVPYNHAIFQCFCAFRKL